MYVKRRTCSINQITHDIENLPSYHYRERVGGGGGQSSYLVGIIYFLLIIMNYICIFNMRIENIPYP